jgi:hypothetical protein
MDSILKPQKLRPIVLKSTHSTLPATYFTWRLCQEFISPALNLDFFPRPQAFPHISGLLAHLLTLKSGATTGLFACVTELGRKNVALLPEAAASFQ